MNYYITYSQQIINKITVLIILFTSCSQNNQNEKVDWLGRVLVLPEVTSNQNKIVVRFEGDCPACVRSIDEWKKFVESIKIKNEELKFVFYIESVRIETFNVIKEKLYFIDYVINDYQATFFRKNLLKYPFNIEDQTFLLNEKNQILLIGNPIIKKQLTAKYLRKV